MELFLKTSDQLNPDEWDEFISESEQGAPFLKYHWINEIHPGWKALIVKEDKQTIAVMPLNIRQKLFWRFAQQPLFSMFWGICFQQNLNELQQKEITLHVLDFLKSKIQYLKYYFSPKFPDALFDKNSDYKLSHRVTHQITLKTDPYVLFSDSAKRQIKKAIRNGYTIHKETNSKALEIVFRENTQILKPGELRLLFRLIQNSEIQKNTQILSVSDAQNSCIAAGVFIKDKDTLYYLAGAIIPEHRSSGSMSLLLFQAMLYGISEGISIFDFEGSSEPGIARFFKTLGGMEIPYLCLEINHLPELLKWIKQ